MTELHAKTDHPLIEWQVPVGGPDDLHGRQPDGITNNNGVRTTSGAKSSPRRR